MPAISTSRAAAAAPRAFAAAEPGFTLLELLIAVGLLSLLTGMAIGVLGRTDGRAVAASILAGERRAAQMTARAQGVPTEVWLRPGGEGEPATVQSLLLQPVATFGFEPKQAYFNDAMRPTIAGDDVPDGRFGHARRSAAGDKNPLLRWPVTPGLVDLGDGFVIRLDLRLESAARATVLRLPPAIELTLDEELRPIARYRLRDAAGTALVALNSPTPLPLQRWCTLDVCIAGNRAWLQLDGRELVSAAAPGAPQQDADGSFEVSPPEAPIPGVVDEVRWFVYRFGPEQVLPAPLQPAKPYRFAYDLRGAVVSEPDVVLLPPEDS